MNEQQVASIMNIEACASLDENKRREQLAIKLHVFDFAFFNFEAIQMEHKKTADNVEDGRYKFVPFPCGFFVDLILDAFFFLGQDRSKKFLDVGCGMGTKVILANAIFDAHGIEYDTRYVKIAHSLNLTKVKHADALSFDRYEDFDFIYYFRPIQDSVVYREFESKIHKDSKPGTLIAPMHTEYNWIEQEDIELINAKPYPKLYRKK